jgi:hypothetical protein
MKKEKKYQRKKPAIDGQLYSNKNIIFLGSTSTCQIL